MLIELFGKNFGCFKEDFQLSMLADPIDEGKSRGVVDVSLRDDPEPLRLLRCAAIFGANASGKSTVMLAAHSLAYMLENSARSTSEDPIPIYLPFQLDPTSRMQPVFLGVRGVVAGVVYEYSISFDHKRLIGEQLASINPDGVTLLLDRNATTAAGEWHKDAQFQLLSQSFRPNALLLALADSLAPSLAGQIATGLKRLLRYYAVDSFGPWSTGLHVAERADRDPAFANWLRPRLRDIDVGVADYTVETTDLPPRTNPPTTATSSASRKTFKLSLLHTSADELVSLPYWRESTGTRRFLDFAPILFDLSNADTATTYFVDELDASLHPTLVRGLITHFNCELPADRIKGQVIFAGHNIELMEGEAKEAVLRRDQVYFTEKATSGAARLYPLAEFKERNNLNIRKRYLQGRYGALPSLGDFQE